MIEAITQGSAILLVGLFAILTYLSIVLRSPIALFGWAMSLMGLGLYTLEVTSPELTMLIYMLHGFTIVLTGVYENI